MPMQMPFPGLPQIQYHQGRRPATLLALAVTAAGQDDTQGDLSEWEAAQMADPDIQVVRRYVEQGMIPSGHERKTGQLDC